MASGGRQPPDLAIHHGVSPLAINQGADAPRSPHGDVRADASGWYIRASGRFLPGVRLSLLPRGTMRVLLLCFVLLTLWGCKSKTEPGPILIGHLAPLSGPGKRLGQQARQAILLAVKEANEEENRIAGRRIAVLHIDSHGDLDALQPEAVRLITVNHVVA